MINSFDLQLTSNQIQIIRVAVGKFSTELQHIAKAAAADTTNQWFQPGAAESFTNDERLVSELFMLMHDSRFTSVTGYLKAVPEPQVQE